MGVLSSGALLLLHAVLIGDRLTSMTLPQLRESGVSTEPSPVHTD